MHKSLSPSLFLAMLSGISILPLLADQPAALPEAVEAVRIHETASQTIDITSADHLEKRQEKRLQDALSEVPGALSTSLSGQEGAFSSVFLRGLRMRDNLLLLDGVSVSPSLNGGNHSDIIGFLELGGGDHTEVLLGNQSITNGGSSAGGVIAVSHSFDQAEQGAHIFAEYGSDGFLRAQYALADTYGDFDYYFNSGYTELEHDDVDRQLENRQISAGVRYRLDSYSYLEFTARAGFSTLSGDEQFQGADYGVVSLKYLQDREAYQSATTLGYVRQLSDFSVNNSLFPIQLGTDYEKLSLSSKHQWQLNDLWNVGLGLDASIARFEDFQLSVRELDETIIAPYFMLEVDLAPMTYNAGLRLEENSLYGFLPSYELGAHMSLEELGSEVYMKATHSKRTPNFSEAGLMSSGGADEFSNPSLEAEDITTLELGVEQKLGGNTQLSLMGYAYFLEGDIDTTFDIVIPIGIVAFGENSPGTSEVFGFDAALTGSFLEDFHYQLVWAYSMKNDLFEDFPKNAFHANLYYEADKWLLGGSLSHRSSTSFNGSNELDAHFVTRLYGQYKVAENITLTARIENLLDEEYEVSPFASEGNEVFGRGLSFYAGLKSSW